MPGKIALVNMPFGFHIYPSIQLGTLTTLLKKCGWEVRSFYLNLHFARQIDLPVYNQLCEKSFLTGDWLFSHTLFGDAPKNREYAEHFRPHIREVCQSIDRPESFLLDVKTKLVPEYLNWAVNAFNWGDYDVVGFTSTFSQNLASVTLAKMIKEKFPKIKILFGGSNFESEMGLEYFRAFPWIDFAVPGEAEVVLPELMQAIDDGSAIPKGIFYRKEDGIGFEECHEMFNDFAQAGVPDYDDFFEQLAQIFPNSYLLDNPIVLYETSRGCWWGEKHHCTFCGLNAQTMKFRSKPVEQVLEEIAYLSDRYDTFRFRIVDNILEMKYLEGVFTRFAEGKYDLQIFLEVKSNLTKSQIKTLAFGGANVIQPGIESFSVNQLQEMDKGVRPMQNILCLKWSFYYGVEVTWNILTGFPRETDEDYRQQIDILKSLYHLQPPTMVGNLWLERFSPYFTRPEEYGIKMLGPGEAYPYTYDASKIDLTKTAYYFEYETERSVDPRLVEELQQTITDWKARHASDQTPFLFYTKSIHFVTVYDGRWNGESTKTRFDGLPAWIIDFCNENPKTLEQIKSHVEKKAFEAEKLETLEGVLKDLQDKRILYGEKGKYLTLALPHNSRL